MFRVSPENGAGVQGKKEREEIKVELRQIDRIQITGFSICYMRYYISLFALKGILHVIPAHMLHNLVDEATIT